VVTLQLFESGLNSRRQVMQELQVRTVMLLLLLLWVAMLDESGLDSRPASHAGATGGTACCFVAFVVVIVCK
jgi:hypothetical protein